MDCIIARDCDNRYRTCVHAQTTSLLPSDLRIRELVFLQATVTSTLICFARSSVSLSSPPLPHPIPRFYGRTFLKASCDV